VLFANQSAPSADAEWYVLPQVYGSMWEKNQRNMDKWTIIYSVVPIWPASQANNSPPQILRRVGRENPPRNGAGLSYPVPSGSHNAGLEEQVPIFVTYQQGHFRVTPARSFRTLAIRPLFSIDVAEILAQVTWPNYPMR
jgi:hypothetical protein